MSRFKVQQVQSKSLDALVQTTVAVGALIVLGLIVSNIAILLMAGNFNEHICRNVAESGARAYDEENKLSDVQSAIAQAINKQSSGGYFISSPVLTEIKYYVDSKNGKKRKMLSVRTSVCVRLPAPFLVLYGQCTDDGRLLINAKCIIELAPPALSSLLN